MRIRRQRTQMPFVCFRSTASESSGLYLLSNFAPTPFTLTVLKEGGGLKATIEPDGTLSCFEKREHARDVERRRGA